MRVLAAVVVGGVLIALRYWNQVDSVHWIAQLGFVAAVAIAVGFVAGHRGWLPALAAFVIGHALWVVIEMRPSMPWAASDVWHWQQWQMFLVTLLPTAVGAAALGALGAWLSRVATRRRPSLRTG